MTAPVVGGFPGGTVLEVSARPTKETGAARAVQLRDLQHLVEEAARLGIPDDTAVIFGAPGAGWLAGTQRVRVTQAGVRWEPPHVARVVDGAGGVDQVEVYG